MGKWLTGSRKNHSAPHYSPRLRGILSPHLLKKDLWRGAPEKLHVDTSFGAGESITLDTGSYIALASVNRCCLGALSPRLARLEMHLATHLPRQPSGLEDRVYKEGSPFRTGPIATLADLEEIT